MKELIRLANRASLLHRMRHNMMKSQAELEEIQEEKLRTVLSYAAENVPAYRHLKEARLRDLDDLPSLPFAVRKDMKADIDSFISRRHRKEDLIPFHTSGSSGAPLQIFYSKSEMFYASTLSLHQHIQAGMGPFSRIYFIRHKPKKMDFLSKLGFFRTKFLHMYDDEKKNLDILKQGKADLLRSYPSTLSLLAHANEEHGYDLHIPKIFCNSEKLPKEARKKIARSFSGDVRDFYGTNEMSFMAWECEKGSMHLHSDSVILEVIDENGEPAKGGRTGEVVLTSLFRYTQPFIRYRIGDIAAMGGRCSCGRGTPVLKSIDGKCNDFIYLSDGRPFTPIFIEIKFLAMPEIILYQAVQEREGELILKVVTSKRLSDKRKEEMVSAFNSCVPLPMDITIEEVDSLPRGRTGKISSVVSKIARRD